MVRSRKKRGRKKKWCYIPIANKRIDLMAPGAEPAELDPFRIGNLLGVAVAPFHRHVRIGVGVHQYVERAGCVELW